MYMYFSLPERKVRKEAGDLAGRSLCAREQFSKFVSRQVFLREGAKATAEHDEGT